MIPHGYIFLGPEVGKKSDAIDGIRKKISAGRPMGDSSLEETVYYAGETPLVEIANSVRNHSLFASPRLFIIKNAELIKKKDETALIASCMQTLETDTVLILVSDEFKLAAGLDDCVPKENRKVFYELFENEKSEWVRSFFAREGYRIDPDGIDTILELVENNTDAMRRECSRLTLFLPKEKIATAQDVEKWLSHSREESAFTLFSRIASGDISRSIESLHTLLAAKESATGILASLAWCFKKLRDYLTLVSSGGESNNFELKKIGVSSPKARSDYAAAARRYNMAAADACLALTAEYDIRTRAAGNAFESVLMDVFIMKIFSLSGRK
jgi:DNA polymerase-3 subunit delta